MTGQSQRAFEWPTLGVLALCYGAWIGVVFGLSSVSLLLAVFAGAFVIALFSSLQHEMIHGHPFASDRANAALVWPELTLIIPFARFRDTHLAHHRDARLTDPYDDPESNYLDPGVWEGLPLAVQMVLRINNTLAGRIIIGPLVGTFLFLRSEWLLAIAGNRAVRAAWAWHLLPMSLVSAVVLWSPMPLWAYCLSVYGALGLLRIRTFLEHQAHIRASGRTVVIEDRGVLAFLFLNNNFHAVHHMHPKVPWYKLPALYHAHRARYLERNAGYCYASYAEVFRRYLFRAKDPVAHPLWRRP